MSEMDWYDPYVDGRYRYRPYTAWTSKDGRVTLLVDMDDRHLANTIIYLSKREEDAKKYLDKSCLSLVSCRKWIDAMKRELKRRAR